MNINDIVEIFIVVSFVMSLFSFLYTIYLRKTINENIYNITNASNKNLRHSFDDRFNYLYERIGIFIGEDIDDINVNLDYIYKYLDDKYPIADLAKAKTESQEHFMFIQNECNYQHREKCLMHFIIIRNSNHA